VPLIPAALPLWAYLATGAAAFVVARAAQAGAGTAPSDAEAPPPDAKNADSLWQSFGGGASDPGWGQITGPGGILPPNLPPGDSPVSPPVAPPPPSPSPTAPLCWPGGPARPSGATRWARISSTHFRLFTYSGGAVTAGPYGSLSFSAWMGPNVTLKVSTGGTATFAKILSGVHAGRYVHTSDPGITWHNCAAGTR